MSIELDIKITSPLTPDDRDLLSGIAVMTLAIANRELAKQGFPDTFPDEEEPDEPAKLDDGVLPHQHTWVAGTLAIEDCSGCEARRLAADLAPPTPYLPALKVN